MSKVLINDTTMTEIGNAIREKLFEEDKYYPREMPDKIRQIGGEIIIQDEGDYNFIINDDSTTTTANFYKDALTNQFFRYSWHLVPPGVEYRRDYHDYPIKILNLGKNEVYIDINSEDFWIWYYEGRYDQFKMVYKNALYQYNSIEELNLYGGVNFANMSSTLSECNNIKKLTIFGCKVNIFENSKDNVIISAIDGNMNDYSLYTNGNTTMSDLFLINTFYKYTPWYNSRENLKEIVIGEYLRTIGENSFKELTNVETLRIESHYFVDAKEALSSLSGLKNIYIPDADLWSSINISTRDFFNIVETNNINVYIEDSTILENIVLKTAKIAKNFENFKDIKTVLLEDSVEKIGDYAFQGCTNLTDIIISNSVTEIGYDAFKNTAYSNNDSNWLEDYLYIDNYLVEVKEDIVNFNPSSNPRIIANGICKEFKSLENATIPDSINVIPKDCFRFSSLQNIEFTDNIERIEESAFYANDISNIIFSENSKLEYIGKQAFASCDSLDEIRIPKSIKKIDKTAFSNSKANKVYLPISVSYWCSDNIDLSEDSLSSPTNALAYTDGTLYINNKAVTNLIIPSDVTKLKKGVFAGATIKTLTISNGAKKIEEYAFYNCRKLQEVVISESVEKIDMFAFDSCFSLDKVVIKNRICSIDDWAFGKPPIRLQGIVIYGYKHSTAEAYALTHLYEFVEITE